MLPPLRDADIRPALTAWVKARSPHARVLGEVGLLHGGVRVDLAVLSPRVLHGFEVKSDVDTVRRLAAQVAGYSRVLDRCTVVAGAELLSKVLPLTPPWWGLLVAHRRPEGVVLAEVRPDEVNPAVESLATAQLLWRDEALAVLRRVGQARGMSGRTRHALYGKLVQVLPPEALRRHVRRVLLARKDWSGRVR